MRVLIIGAGQVGESIAADLAHAHDVVIIERDPDRCEELTYSLDVLTINGDGTAVSTLEEAGIADADMVVASTDDDETNIVACSTAKAVSDAFTIARIKHTEYLRTWERSRKAFGIDFMVCTNLLTAENIVRVIGLPAARDVDPFADGLVQMAEFVVSEESPLVGQTVSEADQFDSLTFASIIREHEIVIPRGETLIEAGDRAVVIGSPGSVRGFAAEVAPEEHVGTSEEVVIVGGSEIGYHTARLLGQSLVADELLFLTDVDCAYLNFGEADQRPIGATTPAALREHLDAGEFGEGSMRPKVAAAARFVAEGGERAIITSPDRLADALDGDAALVESLAEPGGVRVDRVTDQQFVADRHDCHAHTPARDSTTNRRFVHACR